MLRPDSRAPSGAHGRLGGGVPGAALRLPPAHVRQPSGLAGERRRSAIRDELTKGGSARIAGVTEFVPNIKRGSHFVRVWRGALQPCRSGAWRVMDDLGCRCGEMADARDLKLARQAFSGDSLRLLTVR